MEQIKNPLENYRDRDALKIYVSDLGLLRAKKDFAAKNFAFENNKKVVLPYAAFCI